MEAKIKTQRRHALQRAAERYGLNLTRLEFDGLIRDIQEGRAKLVERQSNRVALYEVEIARCNDLPGDGPSFTADWQIGKHPTKEVVTALVAYDRQRKMIASFLPR